MAWFGQIESFQLKGNGWEVGVGYYDDATPSARIRRTITLPLSATKPQAIAEIKRVGVEVMRVHTLNTEDVIGQIIPVP